MSVAVPQQPPGQEPRVGRAVAVRAGLDDGRQNAQAHAVVVRVERLRRWSRPCVARPRLVAALQLPARAARPAGSTPPCAVRPAMSVPISSVERAAVGLGQLVEQEQQFGRGPARRVLLRVASDELDDVEVVGGEAEHHPEPRIGRGRLDVGLQQVALDVAAHDGGQLAVVGIVAAGQLRDRRQARPAVAARPRRDPRARRARAALSCSGGRPARRRRPPVPSGLCSRCRSAAAAARRSSRNGSRPVRNGNRTSRRWRIRDVS